MNPSWKSHLGMWIVVFCFSMNIPVAKSLTSGIIDPKTLAFLRVAFACVFFWFISLFFEKERIKGKKDYLLLMICGFFGTAFKQFIFMCGVSRTAPTHAAILSMLPPLITLFIATIWFNESLSLKKILGVLLGGAGAIWVTLSHGAEIGGGDVLGDIFVILSCFSYSIYIVLVKNIASRYQPITIAKWMALFALLYMFPLGIGDLRECKFFYQILPCEAYFSLFFILVFVSGIANLCIPYSLKNLKSTTVTSYNYFIPIIASFTSIAIGQDFFSWNKLLAGIMVFMGVLFVNQSKERV